MLCASEGSVRRTWRDFAHRMILRVFPHNHSEGIDFDMMNQYDKPCCQPTGRVTIVEGTPQRFHELYPTQVAIRQGTLFPELDKTLNRASSPSGCAEPTRAQEMGFAAWEIRLYLDTHSNDECALHLYRELCEQCPCQNYACVFAQGECTDHWNWVEDPWPWEICANQGRD